MNEACLKYLIVLCALLCSYKFFVNCIVGYREGVSLCTNGMGTIHEFADFFQWWKFGSKVYLWVM